MYFILAITSGMPWCFDISPLLTCLSTSPPSASPSEAVDIEPSSYGSAPSGDKAALGSMGWRGDINELFLCGFARRGDVSVAVVSGEEEAMVVRPGAMRLKSCGEST